MNIFEYLEKQETELNNEKIQKKEDLELIVSKLKENEKFYELLKSEDDNTFNEFSPREINQKNKEKMEDIKNTIDSLEIEKENIEERIFEIDNKLLEIEGLMEDTSKDKINISNNKDIDINYNLDKIIHTLECIQSYSLSDPGRTNIELKQLIKDLKNI